MRSEARTTRKEIRIRELPLVEWVRIRDAAARQRLSIGQYCRQVLNSAVRPADQHAEPQPDDAPQSLPA